MALNYTTWSPQFGAVLRILRKRAAIIEHALNAADVTSNSDIANLVVSNGFADSVNNEAALKAAFKTESQGSQVDALRTQYRNYRARAESMVSGIGRKLSEDLAASDIDRAAGPIKYIYDDVSGTISIVERRGWLGALYRDSVTNTKYMTASAAAVGSLSAEAGNRGTLSKTSASSLSHCFAGTLRVEVSSEDVSHPKLRIYHQLTKPLPDGTAVRKAENLLECEKTFVDGPIGIYDVVLTRNGLASPTVTDPDNVVSSESVTSPQTGDCDHGVWYMKYTRQTASPNWIIELFSDGSRTVKTGRVTTDTTAGSVALSVTCNEGSVVNFTFSRATAAGVISAGQSNSSIQIDIKTPREGDKWYLPTTNDEAGVFVTKVGQNWPITLPTGVTTYTEADASSISMS